MDRTHLVLAALIGALIVTIVCVRSMQPAVELGPNDVEKLVDAVIGDHGLDARWEARRAFYRYRGHVLGRVIEGEFSAYDAARLLRDYAAEHCPDYVARMTSAYGDHGMLVAIESDLLMDVHTFAEAAQ